MKKRILSIDYGMKRCGMALSDTLHISINALPTIHTPDLKSHIVKLLKEYEVDTIVFGESYHVDGTKTHITESIEKEIRELRKYIPSEIKITFVDESMSSHEAKHILLLSGVKKKDRKNKALTDEISAKIILKRYLDSMYL